MPTADLPTAALSWRALARRLRLPALVAAAVAAVLLVAGGPAEAFADALRRAVHADARWVALAVGFEVLSFAGYVVLLWHVAGRGNPRFGLAESYRTTVAGAAVTRLLPTAGVGGAALTLWVLRRSGRPGRDGARTLLTFLVLLYAVFLAGILVSGALLAAGLAEGGSVALALVPALAAAAAITVALGLAARPPRRRGPLTRAGALLGEAVRGAIGLVRGRDPRLLGAVAWWGCDIAVLWAVFNAVGEAPAAGVLVLGYFLGQVANTIPLPGAASGGLIGVMLAFGVSAGLALAGVLAYRAIAIWLPAPAGAHALGGLRRDAARWAREDGMEAPPAARGRAARMWSVRSPFSAARWRRAASRRPAVLPPATPARSGP